MQTNKLLALKMTENHSFPITPTPELVQQWTDAFWNEPGQYVGIDDEALATRAAQWGADQELDACCEWLMLNGYGAAISRLRAARRPKPPSLKEQSLNALSHADKDALTDPLTGEVVALRTILSKDQADTIRRALEALPDG